MFCLKKKSIRQKNLIYLNFENIKVYGVDLVIHNNI